MQDDDDTYMSMSTQYKVEMPGILQQAMDGLSSLAIRADFALELFSALSLQSIRNEKSRRFLYLAPQGKAYDK